MNLGDLAPAYSGNDPIDYELYCAELLRSVGWDARTTRASNDQGSDVIATKDGVKLIVQCKLYTRRVGNAAVQEVSAARAHELGDHAAVVTNADFTSAAKSLAQTNNVVLLHHEQLQDYGNGLSASSDSWQTGSVSR